MTAPRILALDLSKTRTGVAHSDGLVTSWRLPMGTGVHRGHALNELRLQILRLDQRHPITHIVYELAAIVSNSKGHQKTSGINSMLEGAMLDAAYKLGSLPTHGVYPNQLKKFATGNGRASKADMIRMCKTLYGVDVGTNDDEADARHLLAYGQQYWGKQAQKMREIRETLF